MDRKDEFSEKRLTLDHEDFEAVESESEWSEPVREDVRGQLYKWILAAAAVLILVLGTFWFLLRPIFQPDRLRTERVTSPSMVEESPMTQETVDARTEERVVSSQEKPPEPTPPVKYIPIQEKPAPRTIALETEARRISTDPDASTLQPEPSETPDSTPPDRSEEKTASLGAEAAAPTLPAAEKTAVPDPRIQPAKEPAAEIPVVEARVAPKTPVEPVKPAKAPPKREVAPAPQPKPSPPRTVWYVQIGAYSQEAAARRMQGQFERAGYPARVMEIGPAGKKLHATRVGPYSSESQARTAAETIKQQGHQPYVLSIQEQP